MPYSAGHGAEVRKNIVQSARRLFNRHGFENVSLSQIMAGAGLTHGGFYTYFKSKSDLYAEVLGCFLTDPEWRSCCGRECTWICHPPTSARKWFAPICRPSISRTSRTPAQWWHCRAISRAAARAPSALSRTYCGRWLTSSNAACRRRSGGVTPERAPSRLCAWAAWFSLAPWTIALSPTNSATHVWASRSSLAAGTMAPSRRVPNLGVRREGGKRSGSGRRRPWNSALQKIMKVGLENPPHRELSSHQFSGGSGVVIVKSPYTQTRASSYRRVSAGLVFPFLSQG